MPETSTTLAVVSTAASVGLALYVLKLRADIAAPASSKKTVKTVTKTTVRDANGDKLWAAEELIAERRSIFPPDYDSSKKVSRHVMDNMLAAANWAPTHGKTEPWRFVVFDAPEKRLEVGQLMADWYKTNVPADKFLESKYKKMIFNCTASSHVIAICMKRQKSGKIPEWEEMCAVACAVQNMHLVATAHNVAAYWSSGPPITMAQEMKDHLKLEEADKCLGLFYVGVPKEDAKIPKVARKPIENKVTWVSA
ncbi:Nitroreductase [Phytophthora cactorum]|nr:Nitroreductase [Phytophthora cactorum]